MPTTGHHSTWDPSAHEPIRCNFSFSAYRGKTQLWCTFSDCAWGFAGSLVCKCCKKRPTLATIRSRLQAASRTDILFRWIAPQRSSWGSVLGIRNCVLGCSRFSLGTGLLFQRHAALQDFKTALCLQSCIQTAA